MDKKTLELLIRDNIIRERKLIIYKRVIAALSVSVIGLAVFAWKNH